MQNFGTKKRKTGNSVKTFFLKGSMIYCKSKNKICDSLSSADKTKTEKKIPGLAMIFL